MTIAVSRADNGLTLIGSKYFTSDYTASVVYCGVTADSVVINSETLIDATWNKDLPPCQKKVAPILSFQSTTSDLMHIS